MKKRNAFTLIEVLIVVIILGILATIAVPSFQGVVVKAKFSELHTTVAAIERTSDLFYLENGFYAAYGDGEVGNDLAYSTTQVRIDNFSTVLGIDIPGLNSIFVYGVYYDPARIYVRVREHYADWGILCYKYIEGANKGNWGVVGAHPWAQYFNIP